MDSSTDFSHSCNILIKIKLNTALDSLGTRVIANGADVQVKNTSSLMCKYGSLITLEIILLVDIMRCIGALIKPFDVCNWRY